MNPSVNENKGQDDSSNSSPRANNPSESAGKPTEIAKEEELLMSSGKELARNLKGMGTTDPKRTRLCGAARKRLQFLIKSGVPEEEARIKAKQPFRPLVVKDAARTNKRQRSDGSTPDKLPGKRAKRQEAVPRATAAAVKPEGKAERRPTPTVKRGAISYNQAVHSVKVGVILQGYPESLMSEEQIANVQQTILDAIVGQGKDQFKPAFLQAHQRPGWLALTCANRATADWVKGLEAQLKPWEGANLKVVEAAEMPHNEILIGYFPSSAAQKAERILALVAGQNDLDTSSWRVLRQQAIGPTQEVTLAIDCGSAAKVRSLGLKVNYGFGQVTLRERRKTQGADPKAVASTSSSTGQGTEVNTSGTPDVEVAAPPESSKGVQQPKNSGGRP